MTTVNMDTGIPPLDRPREKLLLMGADGLGTNELLAVVLGTGTRYDSALDLANQILGAVGGVKGLARLSAEELTGIRGLKEARAARVLASLELGRRVISEPESPRPSFRAPEDAGRYLLPRFGLKPVEEFGVLALDTRNRLKKLCIISKGSLNGSLVHPREVYREAVTLRAAGLILFHNHPSGDPTPSQEDLELTRRLREAGRIMGIEILDHIILGAGCFLSFKDKGLI
jgi:DNA repair protein RadC